MDVDITQKGIENAFKEKILELQEEPEFQCNREQIKYAADGDGAPIVKVAVGNVPVDYDLWEGLRNPAVVGLHPIGLREIWEFYSNRVKQKIDENGRRTIFQIPRPFDVARRDYGRAVIVSVMLPFSPGILEDSTRLILERRKGASYEYSKMYKDVNRMLDMATMRVGIDLVTDDTVVVAMTKDMIQSVSEEALPQTRQGNSHGPCKLGNYSQKSVAALLGLGQFGVSNLVFRDELIDGKVERYHGTLRSIIMFDKEALVTAGRGGFVNPTDRWRDFLLKLYDFTNVEPEINKYRFCSYIPYNGKGCGKCISYCPSNALANSVPNPKGVYPEGVLKQAHRFWEGNLQFDFGRCRDDRSQMGTLFSEWHCARCGTVCVTEGTKREDAVKIFSEERDRLTKEM